MIVSEATLGKSGGTLKNSEASKTHETFLLYAYTYGD